MTDPSEFRCLSDAAFLVPVLVAVPAPAEADPDSCGLIVGADPSLFQADPDSATVELVEDPEAAGLA